MGQKRIRGLKKTLKKRTSFMTFFRLNSVVSTLILTLNFLVIVGEKITKQSEGSLFSMSGW